MTTISSATPTISSAGIGSGLDVNSIVSSLMAIERQPLTRLQTSQSNLQTELSDFGQIQSLFSSLHDAAAPLFDPTTFTQVSSGSSDPTTVAASATGTAVPGLYSVAVSSLASTQAVVSAAGQFTDSTATVGSGSLTIALGSYATGGAPLYATTFTPKAAASPITIAVASTDTLANVRDKINAANAGVTATLVTDATGVRLALQSSSTGASNAFQVTVADDDGNSTDNAGLSRFAFDATGTSSQLARTQTAGNAQATVNGISVSSETNSLSGVIDGVTFNLGKISPVSGGVATPVTVSITRNTDAVKTQLNNFVSAYNALNSFMNAQTKYDSTSKTAGPLQGDSAATSLENQLHSMISQSTGASSIFSTFSSLGVQVQKDGSLSLNDAVTSAALTNLPEVTKALSNVDSTNSANTGLGKRFTDWTSSLLSYTGTLPGKTRSIQAEIDSNQKDQDDLSDRLTLIQQRIQAQYTALDSTMSQANSLAKFVTQSFSTTTSSSSS